MKIKRILSILISCGLAMLAWVVLIEPDRLVVRQTPIRLKDWPDSLNGLRIAAISDLHPGGFNVSVNKLRLIVERTNELQPDLILLAGDFVDTACGLFPIEPEVTAQELKNLRARYGIFAVLGNHDWWYDGSRVKTRLEQAGIHVLENQVSGIPLPDDPRRHLWVVGFGDLWEGAPNVVATLSKLEDNGPAVALTHNPDLFTRIPARVALTIAGHTHGGQVTIPFIGRPVVPSEFGERYAAGYIVEQERHLFVTTGIGMSILPVRFQVPPEISLLTIN